MGYQENISEGLNRAYQRVSVISLDVDTANLVIFSDHHKGVDDRADDFRGSAETYRAALNHYLNLGHTLMVLGDGEELWECRPQPVLDTYQEILALEAQFHNGERHFRFYGNHDDDWSFPDAVARYLGQFFSDLTVHEGLRLELQEAGETLGELFLVHGHQGTTFSDRFGRFSRLVVRYLWRPVQRLTGIKTSTPSSDWRLRHKHDIAMYNWSVDQTGMVLIAGHTHHAIFPTEERAERLAQAYAELEALSPSPEELEFAQADLAFAQQQEQPCYLNSGCCSFDDGSITGIEVDSGEMRLVRWSKDNGSFQRDVLAVSDLRQIFSDVTDRGAPMPASAPAE